MTRRQRRSSRRTSGAPPPPVRARVPQGDAACHASAFSRPRSRVRNGVRVIPMQHRVFPPAHYVGNYTRRGPSLDFITPAMTRQMQEAHATASFKLQDATLTARKATAMGLPTFYHLPYGRAHRPVEPPSRSPSAPLTNRLTPRQDVPLLGVGHDAIRRDTVHRPRHVAHPAGRLLL